MSLYRVSGRRPALVRSGCLAAVLLASACRSGPPGTRWVLPDGFQGCVEVEYEVPGAPALPEEGGLHGHDLALGSGSVDGIVGGQIFWSWGRLFTTAAIQYAVRTTGSFDYHFANDLTWLGGPGWFVLLGHDYSLGLQALLAGETKGNDSQAGVQAHDTAITALYAGPAISVTWRASLGAELAVDLPAIQHNTGLQLLPDARVRGGFTWHF